MWWSTNVTHRVIFQWFRCLIITSLTNSRIRLSLKIVNYHFEVIFGQSRERSGRSMLICQIQPCNIQIVQTVARPMTGNFDRRLRDMIQFDNLETVYSYTRSKIEKNKVENSKSCWNSCWQCGSYQTRVKNSKKSGSKMRVKKWVKNTGRKCGLTMGRTFGSKIRVKNPKKISRKFGKTEKMDRKFEKMCRKFGSKIRKIWVENSAQNFEKMDRKFETIGSKKCVEKLGRKWIFFCFRKWRNN